MTARKSPKAKRPDYIESLPDHLAGFGSEVWESRDLCRKLLADAMEEHEDKIYDAVIDATPKEVLEVMKAGRESILTHADSILSIACDCAGDAIREPATRAETVDDTDPREAGELVGAIASDMRHLNQLQFLQGLVSSLTRDARETLEAML